MVVGGWRMEGGDSCVEGWGGGTWVEGGSSWVDGGWWGGCRWVGVGGWVG